MEDKSRIPTLYASVPDIKIPETIVLNTSGIYYDKDGNVISKAKAIELVQQYLEKNEEAVMKPTRASCGGEGVVILQGNCFADYASGTNFIVQERIVNQEDLRALNPSSLNRY